MSAYFLPNIKTTYFDINGDPLSGGSVFTYIAGTTSLVATFTTTEGIIQNPNPVILDASGSADIYLSANINYKFVVYDKDGVLIDRVEPVFAQQFNLPYIIATDYGAVGDGITDDSAAFVSIEALSGTGDVELGGRTYLVSSPPLTKTYRNGYFKRISDSKILDSFIFKNIRADNHNVVIGGSAGAAMKKFVEYKVSGNPYAVQAIGHEALMSNVSGRNLTAIGHGAMRSLVNGRYNIAIGLESQYYVNSNDGAVTAGTRNVSVGDNSLRFNVTGFSNIAMGRNAGQSITNVNYNTAIGSNAMAGSAPLGLDNTTIENQTPITAADQTHIGKNAGFYSNASGNTTVGSGAGENIKKGQLVALGHNAGNALETNTSYDGYTLVSGSKSGTFVWAGSTITCTVTGHGFSNGWRIKAVLGSHEISYFTIGGVTTNTFVISTPYVNTESGAITISEWITTAAKTALIDVIAIGRSAMALGINATLSTAVGANALELSEGANNVAVGNYTIKTNTAGSSNTGIGYSALRFGASGSSNTAVGEFALANIETDYNTAIGKNAGRNKQDGTSMTSYTNTTCLGYGTAVSGDNQVQIGNSATTTYVYGTVQNRSDLRDKADVQPIVLGLDFINSLNPVQYRWDMRDDYENRTPDGSKKRARFHTGFIAQEIGELIKETGQDFGGYQNHSLAEGGCDVQTLGYDEFIAPLVRAVQELSARVKELEAKLN
mgnify:CR=1 FL=1